MPTGCSAAKREREIAAGLVHAGQHQAEHRLIAAHAGRQGEAPDRRFEKGGKPGVAHQRPAAGDHRLQPGVPGIGEVARQSGADEIAARRQLAVEAGYNPGHLKSRSTPGANGIEHRAGADFERRVVIAER